MGQATKRENTIFVADITRFVNTKNKETKVLMDGFKADHTKMAKVTRADRKKFVKGLDDDVNAMRKGNIAEHKKMAKMTKADREKFVNKLEDSVGAMRKDNVNDLAGARAAWAGLSPQGRKARLMAEQQAKADQERKARVEAEQRAKALEEARAKAQAEKSKTQAQPLSGMKKK